MGLGHARGDSDGLSQEGWKEARASKVDTLTEGDVRRGDEERAVEEIRSRIRGWSVDEGKKMGFGVVSEVSVDGRSEGERGSVGSEEGILGRKKSTKDMGGISKTVVYDVKYESP